MPEPNDRRTTDRFPVNADTACTFISPVVENFGPVKIQNISREGIGLLVSRKVEVGSSLALTLANVSRQFTRTVLIRVAHATQQHGAYLIGGTFNTPLTYEELTKLVL